MVNKHQHVHKSNRPDLLLRQFLKTHDVVSSHRHRSFFPNFFRSDSQTLTPVTLFLSHQLFSHKIIIIQLIMEGKEETAPHMFDD